MGTGMEQQEKKILEIEQEMYEMAIKEKYREELNQEDINQQIGDGLVYIQNQLYKFQRIPFFDILSFMIPEHFQEMREAFVQRKYPNEDRPQVVYTNDSTSINFTLSHTSLEVYGQKFQTYVSQKPRSKLLT